MDATKLKRVQDVAFEGQSDDETESTKLRRIDESSAGVEGETTSSAAAIKTTTGSGQNNVADGFVDSNSLAAAGGNDSTPLRETPWDCLQSPETTASLLQLSFRCCGCDALIIPHGVISRITVRSLPETPYPLASVGAGDHILESAAKTPPTVAVYADSLPAALVRRSPQRNESLATQLATTNRYPGFDPSPHDLHCVGCEQYVGYVLERGDAPGLPAARPNETGRAFKFYYWTPQRGSVLYLDAAAREVWAGMVPRIPPPLPAAAERRGQSELAQELADKLGISVNDVPAIFQRDGAYFRSLRSDEQPSKGLTARSPAATDFTPFQHVIEGSAASRFVSVSSSPSIACLWALPFGSIVAVSEHVAALVGDECIPSDQLERLVAERRDVNSPTAVLRVQSAKEALFVHGVSKFAVERLVSRVSRVHTALRGMGAAAEDGFPTDAAIVTLQIEPFPATLSPSPDMGASFVSDTSTGASYVVLRVSRNSLPPHCEGDTNAAFPRVVEQARLQLEGAFRAYCADGMTGLAYYEVDVEVFQFDRRVTAFDNVSILRLPFLVLKHEGTAEEMRVRLQHVYRLKKGEDVLAHVGKRATTS